MLSENAELSSRLIDVALTSDNDIFEAAFGCDDGSDGHGMATMPLGHWSQEATQKRRQEAQEEVCNHMEQPCMYRMATLLKSAWSLVACKDPASLHAFLSALYSLQRPAAWAAALYICFGSYSPEAPKHLRQPGLRRFWRWAGSRPPASSSAPSSLGAPTLRSVAPPPREAYDFAVRICPPFRMCEHCNGDADVVLHGAAEGV